MTDRYHSIMIDSIMSKKITYWLLLPILLSLTIFADEKAKQINKFIKGLGLKGIQSQTQGDQVRVSGKKRDDLQHIITELKGNDFGIPLQYGNFRD